jgi:G3E family GTPase
MVQRGNLIPVLVVSGFLGSGKTTLIRGLLRNPRMGEVAVIVNEFGEVGLDHYLVRKTDERTVLLKSGCICCSMRGDLSEALRDLLSKRERKQIPPFARVVVETTGLADPVPILHTVVAEPVVHNHFCVQRVVTTVDAPNGATNLASYGEAVRQTAAADCVVVTKQDLVPTVVVHDLKAQLARLNPSASIIDGPFGTVDFDALWDSELRHADPHGIGELAAMDDGSPALHSAHAPGGGITSGCIVVDRPLNWHMFGIWLTMLLHQHGQRILRFKGLLNVGEGRGPLVLQGVQHVVHAPRHLKDWPDEDHRSRIVVIARDLDIQQIETSLNLFQQVVHAHRADHHDRWDHRAQD